MASTKDRIQDVRPYVERAMKDDDLRDNLREAFEAAREVYNELIGDRGVTGVAARVATDDDIQKNLKKTIEELREAADRVRGKEDHGTRNAMLLITGIALGVLFNPMTGPDARRWIREKVFGPEQPFEYQSNSQSSSGQTNSPTNQSS